MLSGDVIVITELHCTLKRSVQDFDSSCAAMQIRRNIGLGTKGGGHLWPHSCGTSPRSGLFYEGSYITYGWVDGLGQGSCPVMPCFPQQFQCHEEDMENQELITEIRNQLEGSQAPGAYAGSASGHGQSR